MRQFLSDPRRCIGLALLLLLFVVAPSNEPGLWAGSLAAFLVALAALGWHRAPVVLVWVVAYNMLSIWADIVLIDLNASGYSNVEIIPEQSTAILQSSVAIAFVAIGMRAGIGLAGPMLGFPGLGAVSDPRRAAGYSMPRLLTTYCAFFPIAAVAAALGNAIPALSQPAHAFNGVKFLLIYMIAATAFAANRHFLSLVGVIAAEIAIGSTGYFSGYKEGVFVVLIAVAASQRGLEGRQALVVAGGALLMVYMSLVWTAIKPEFRSEIASSDGLRSAMWLADKYLSANVDYGAAATSLLERVGYTKFYALVLNANTESLQGIYLRALEHLVTPRFLFPEKAILDDSRQTAQAIGWNIGDGTSIGLGYVAQAYIDFGFPGLIVPMFMLGAFLGFIYAFFMTRPLSFLLREGAAVAVLFRSLIFEGNIDKQIGGLVISAALMALTLHFFGRWMHGLIANVPIRSRGG